MSEINKLKRQYHFKLKRSMNPLIIDIQISLLYTLNHALLALKFNIRKIFKAKYSRNINLLTPCLLYSFLHIRIDDGACSPDVAQKCKNTALQIIILCPALLALPHHFLFEQLTAILNIEKILGILLDVKEQSILDIHKTGKFSYTTNQQPRTKILIVPLLFFFHLQLCLRTDAGVDALFEIMTNR